MNDEERDNLLIRLDERQKVMHEDIQGFKEIVETVKIHAHDIRFIKWLGSAAVTVGGLVLGFLEYLKR